MHFKRSGLVVCLLASSCAFSQTLNHNFDRDPSQSVDAGYTAAIAKYTTDPAFLSPLVNYLPASSTVPTPKAVLGGVAGAPDMLPYAEDVYRYFRLLAEKSPRVQVTSIGKSEEGREMIAAAIADESLLKTVKENDARLAQLSDPRLIGMNDEKAQALLQASVPVYYITGTIHSPETGAPTALMELAYRLAVDDSPYIQYIRKHMIVLITPVVEVDGRDRMVDIYKWHKAHPGLQYPRLLYWGHYVAHDNNRDAMGMTLALTNNVLNTYLGWHAQVLHDLHESVPFLYDNTVGDGPYNAWIDPLLSDEWAELGWNNVAQMQGFGMPGVFTHGDFDTWSPGYLMFLAGMHNGISRLYETFGNGGADTEKRILQPEEYSRTWYRQNPPYPVVTWSQRDNNNYEESALLSTLSYFANHGQHFLENYYTKSKRSILKPSVEGPAAYVLPANEAEGNRQAQLIEVLQRQHVEISRLNEAASLTLPVKHKADDDSPSKPKTKTGMDAEVKPQEEKFPVGSLVIRMDQPYARAADALLDKQYWAPNDPQKTPYDDTGWSFSQLFNLKVVRVTDADFLKHKMTLITPGSDPGLVERHGKGSFFAIANTGQISLLPLIFAMKDAHFSIADASFAADGKQFAPGTLLGSGASESDMDSNLKKLQLSAVRLGSAPAVKSHPVTRPRIAFMHTWLSTQTEGWWRYAFDHAGIPYDYISTQTVAASTALRSKYDVIVFAPVGYARSSDILNGMPMYGNPLPWQKTDLTPNLGLDSTADMRPGLGSSGLEHLQAFVQDGGLLITSEDTARFAIDMGLAPGVSITPPGSARVVGTVLNTVFVQPQNAIAFGYSKGTAVMSADGMSFQVSNTTRGGSGRRKSPETERPTGRGTIGDEDIVEGRKAVEPVSLPSPKPWQPDPLNEEQMRNNPYILPESARPDVILRFADGKDLLGSGLLDNSGSVAEHAVVVDAHLGTGNVLLFACNPVYRGETIGSYPMVFNAIMNFDHLQHGAIAR